MGWSICVKRKAEKMFDNFTSELLGSEMICVLLIEVVEFITVSQGLEHAKVEDDMLFLKLIFSSFSLNIAAPPLLCYR